MIRRLMAEAIGDGAFALFMRSLLLAAGMAALLYAAGILR